MFGAAKPHNGGAENRIRKELTGPWRLYWDIRKLTLVRW